MDRTTTPDTSFQLRLLQTLQEARTKIETLERIRSEALAIVGMGCRFPGNVSDPKGFWQVLSQGADAITEVPKTRWDIDALYDADPDAPGKMCTRYGGFLTDIDLFDASFFGISRKETQGMDPQQRLLLEVCWEAIEQAGIAPASLRGTPAGVFMGIGTFDYAALRYAQQDLEDIDPYFATGGVLSVAAGRLSYALGLTGPSMAVDTACSSSLVAVHLACQSLRARECDVALAGGVNVILLPELSINFSKARMLAPDGRCKTFDASANGYVRGEGCGVIVLKRLSDALAQGDRILALIRGSAVNQDGPSAGLTVPSGPAQEAVIRQALANAAVDADEVGYVEAHGTGTSLGDPIEVGSLGKVFGQRPGDDPLVIGSVKTSIGHLEAAAGIAGLIKVVLALQHGQIPAHLHFHTPSPHIAWEKLPFAVPTQPRRWPAGRTRLAGVSAFGASGTNAHVVLEQGPVGDDRKSASERPVHLLALSAKGEAALKALAGRYADHLAAPAREAIGDVCYTANTGRSHFAQRVAVTGATPEELAAGCRAYQHGRRHAAVQTHDGENAGKVAFLFPDQGPYWTGLSRVLYDTAPGFRAVLDRCDVILKDVLKTPLRDVICSDSDDPACTQPALFAVQSALFEVWQRWGIAPSLVMGHGAGEYAAACAAGVFSLEDGLRLIAGQSGAAEVTYARPRFGIVSSVTGALISDAMAQQEYWERHALAAADLPAAMATLKQQGCTTFLALGPANLPDGFGDCLSSLRAGHTAWQPLLESLGRLYAQGVTPDWQGFDQDYARHKVVLPTYPFQRQRYWIEEKPRSARAAPKAAAGQEGQINPLLGQRLPTAHRDVIFQSRISTDSPAFLGDHRIYGTVVFPATGYLEMALAAGSQVLETETLTLEEVSIRQALILPEAEDRTLQTILKPQDTGGYFFEIHSAAVSGPWHLHATGQIHTGGPQSSLPERLEQVKARCTQPLSVADHYRRFSDEGIAYGPAFQGLAQLMQGQGQSLGFLRASETVAAQLSDYRLHPGWFDASLQTAAALLPTASGQETLLPVGIKRLQISGGCVPVLWSHARLHAAGHGNDGHALDFCLYDDSGRVVVQVDGFAVQRATRATLLEGAAKDAAALYTVSWPAVPLAQHAGELTGRWLIFADAAGLGEKTAQALKAQGAQTALVYPGQAYGRQSADRYQLNPLAPEAFQRLQADTFDGRGCQAVIHLWSLDSGVQTDLAAIEQGQILGCASVLHLVQALGRSAFRPRIWLLTRGAQAGGDRPHPVAAHQSALWGLARVLTLEHPEFQSVCIDLDPHTDADEGRRLLAELAQRATPDGEDRILYRNGVRCAARLVPAGHGTTAKPETPSQRIGIQSYGIIENLALGPMTRRPPGKGEVQIAVRATGLNFRDVLRALGMLKAYEPQLQNAADVRFGFECAGTVSAVGDNVQGLAVGDEVIAGLTVEGSLGSYVTVDAAGVVIKPAGMRPEEAATIPLAFLTAYYGLERLAKLQKGERVLIHAAAGGVGLAAIQIARRAGARIYATASPGKWAYLKSLGLAAVCNSRTLDYAQQIMDLTDGQGVDVILNSLTGEYIPKNLSILAPGGRFIEIGKIGIWDEAQVRRQRPDVRYYPFDLGDVAQNTPGVLHEMLTALMAGFERAELTPLKHTVFGLADCANAFRYMAQAKHIGKVVVSGQSPGVTVRPDATYLITGGLGALGCLIAENLKQKGARSIVLCGRHPAGPDMVDRLARLKGGGTNVVVMQGDIAREEDVRGILQRIETTLPALKGIVHAAGILDDGIIRDQTWARFAKVMAPKVAGAWHLQRQSRDLQLDFLILFSSTASGLGSAGQSNYAAGNAFLDALSHDLRHTGCRATTINWGPWDGIGMAAAHTGAGAARYTKQGVRPIRPADGTKLFDRILSGDGGAQAYALDIDWRAYATHTAARSDAGFLSELLKGSTAEEVPVSALQRQLADASGAQKVAILRASVIDAARKVMGYADAGQIRNDQPLMEQGLDSLLSVELRNLLSDSLAISLPVGLLFNYPSIDDVCRYLADALKIAPDTATDIQVTAAVGNSEDEFAYIDEMDQDELEALIRKEIR